MPTDDALARENSSLRKAIHAALVTKYEGGPRAWWEPLEAALGINPEPPKLPPHECFSWNNTQKAQEAQAHGKAQP